MANRTRTYLTTDWKIETFVPDFGTFVLDFSQLDGTDVLGTTTGSWVANDNHTIAGIVIQDGTSVSGGIFNDITPSAATVQFNVKDYTYADLANYFIGTGIRIMLKNEQTSSDTNYGYHTPIFIGKIQSATVDLQPGADFSTITVTAIHYQDELNRLMTVIKSTTTSNKFAIIDATLFTSGLGDIYYWPFGISTLNFSSNSTETKSVGEWLADLILCDLTVPCLTPNPYSYSSSIYYNNNPKLCMSWFNDTLAASLTESDITGATLDWSGIDAPSGVTLYNYANSAVVYQYGASADQQSNNASLFTGTVDVKDVTQMKIVADTMFKMQKTYGPIEISTVVANKDQDITFLEQDLVLNDSNKYWLLPVNLYQPGDWLEINMASYDISNTMIVTGRTITVSPDNFTATYNLWKGLTL